MNTILKLTKYLAAVAATAAACVGGANATTITYADLTDGLSSVALTGYTASVTGNAAGATFGSKTINGVTGVGVNGGNSVVDAEIDNDETLSFVSAPDANTLHLLQSFTISFLYANGNFGDTVNEVALLDATGNVLQQITLSVVNATTATLSGPGGTVTNLSSGDNGGGGEWFVSGLAVPFSSLVFRAGDGGSTSNLGDFAFVNFTATEAIGQVPEPADLLLIAAALLALGFARRRAR